MKRIVIGLLFLILAVDAFSQIEMRMEDGAGDVDDVVTVILFATRARDVTSFSFPLSFNTDKLEYIDFANNFDPTGLNLDLSDVDNGQIGVSWMDETLMGLNDFRVEFIHLQFRIKEGCRSNDPITYTGTIENKETLKVDDDGNIVTAPTTYFDGEVRTECTRGIIDVDQVNIGEVSTVDVPVFVEDLEGLIAIFFRVSYDQTKLSYVGFDNPYFSRGLNINENDGLITVLWEESDLVPTNVLDRTMFLRFNFTNLMSCGSTADLVIEEADFNAIIDLTVYTEYATTRNGAVNVACLPVASVSTTDIDCFGDSTGAIDLDVSSGLPPYFFEWEDGTTSEDRNEIPAGTYKVTITDANMEELVLDSIVVNQNDEILATINQQGDCQSGNVSVSIIPTGGEAPYNIEWSNQMTGSPILIDNAPITLSVKVTDDLTCEKEFTNILVEEVESFTLDVMETDVKCKGDNNGSIDLIIEGGAEPFDYSWIGPDNFMADTKDIDGLAPGMYSISVEDNNNCSGFISIEIMEPEVALSADVSVTGDDGSSNGTATCIPQGGIQPYDYAWSCSSETNPIVENLGHGDCCVTVSDNGGCEIEECFNIELVESNNEITGVENFLIFPNPVESVLNINLELSAKQNLSVQLVNDLGQVIYENNYRNTKEIKEGILMQSNSSGSYMLKLVNDKNEQLIRRIIKL